MVAVFWKKNSIMIKILDVSLDSLAWDVGIKPNDFIVEINGQAVRDEIDYLFFIAEKSVRLKILQQDKVKTISIKNNFADIGLTLEEMKTYSCGSNCVFCFVNQNPKGLRGSLYFQDGDYRMSFLYGNYITLTNVGESALKRIVEQKLSPLYISVHSTLPDVRKQYMNLKKDDRLLKKMTYLVENGISLHSQIVLSPNINDGDSLMKTIDDLYKLNYGVESLAIVPVGLTKHRKNLPKIKPVTAKYAKELIEIITPIQKKFKNEKGNNWLYLSDEFYILSGTEIPRATYYDDYPQIENGVGMLRLFFDDFIKSMRRAPKALKRKKRITFLTGTLAYNFMNENVIPHLNKIKNLETSLIPIKNRMFGSSVTVTGLLSGKSILKGVENIKLGDLVVLPSNTLNHDSIFLGNMTTGEFSSIIKRPVFFFDLNWRSLFEYVENL
jgi:putative radical SAM enzyme (TIGR03279 family)